jgi:hypothetical protein
VGLLGFNTYKQQKEIDRLNTLIYTGIQIVKKDSIEIAGLTHQLYTAEASVVSSQNIIRRLEDEKEYFRKLHISDLKSISKLQLEVEVLKKQGAYRDTIIKKEIVTIKEEDSFWDNLNLEDNVDITVDENNIKIASWKDEWAYCDVALYPAGPLFDFGLYESAMRVNIYYSGIIKPKPIVAITTPNPYIKINSANTIIVEDKKKLLQKNYPYLVGGAILGFIISSAIL